VYTTPASRQASHSHAEFMTTKELTSPLALMNFDFGLNAALGRGCWGEDRNQKSEVRDQIIIPVLDADGDFWIAFRWFNLTIPFMKLR
jgi:hypothetical protein